MKAVGTSYDKLPRELTQPDKESQALKTNFPRAPVYVTGCQDTCRYMHPLMAETRKVTKPSSQDIEQDKKPRQQAYRDACVLWQTKRQRQGKVYLWEEKDLQPVSTQSNPRVAESKKLASPKFSPANLNLEKQKLTTLASIGACRQRSGRLTW